MSTDLPECTCTNYCPEDREENGCPHCRGLDIYDPCPTIGFGCGWNPAPCDCCSPEQRAKAAA